LRLKLNGTHQILAYADDVNLQGDNIDTKKKKMETLIDASKEVGPEINVEKTKYMLLSLHWNKFKKKKPPWSESASDRRLLAKLLPTCAYRGCHVVSVTDPSGRILSVF
jgi:hypothetical protein